MDLKESINYIIQQRRAIFPVCYTGEKVDDEIIKNILQNANWAPTHKKTEPWRFIVFSENGLIELSEFSSKAYRTHVSPDKYSEVKFNKTKEKVLKASHVIAIIMKRHEDLLPEWEEIASVACAVQNMWLTCTAYGLGSYWSTPLYLNNESQYFGLELDQKCLGLFYVGVPKKGLEFQGDRADISDKVIWRK